MNTKEKKVNSNTKNKTNKKIENIKEKSSKKTNKLKDEVQETKAFLKKVAAKSNKKLKSEKEIEFTEFYDLPLRYNNTIVRLISQTPTKLFVYWDILDKDRENLEKKYSKNLWNETVPVLLVKNNTDGSTFEVLVNDFANSWYIDIPDNEATYEVIIGRKYKEKNDEYIYITSSNEYTSSNEHITLNNDENILFENIKTNIKYYIKNTDKIKENASKIYNIDKNVFNNKEQIIYLNSLSGSSHMEKEI